jgi:hypothetical protein
MEEFRTDSTLTIIKGKFKAPASSSFGLFIAFMDNLSKNVERFDVLASHFSTVFENNINIPWSEQEELITKMKWKGEYANNLTHDVQASLEDLFEPGTGRGLDIWQALKKLQVSKAVAVFEEYLMRPTGDKQVKCEIAIETVNKSDIEQIKKERTEKNSQDLLKSSGAASETHSSDGLNIAESAVVLDVDIVLSPISGVLLTELKQGDKILVKISETTSRGQYFIDLLGASVENEIVPIPANIEKITFSGKYYNVFVNIGPGIYGKSITEDNLKAKLYNPAQDKRKNIPQQTSPQHAFNVPASTPLTEVQEEKKEKNAYLIFFIIGGMALLLLLILIFLFI